MCKSPRAFTSNVHSFITHFSNCTCFVTFYDQLEVRLGQARARTGEWPITYPFSTQTDRYQSLEVFGERIVAAANGGRWDVNAHSRLHSMLHAVTLDQWAPGGGFVDCIGTFCLTSSRSSYTPQVSMTSYCHHLRIYGS